MNMLCMEISQTCRRGGDCNGKNVYKTIAIYLIGIVVVTVGFFSTDEEVSA